ncbi:MAG: ABC transporter permease [Tenericutes bacterium]|nr:ABC transporter permease [Mycoplasmatota bacterium]
MKKFKFLVGFGLSKRIMKKSFIISNIIIGILIIGIINIPSIISLFSDDTDEIQNVSITVINNTNDIDYPLEVNIVQILNQSYEQYSFEDTDYTFTDESSFWEQEEIDVLIIFNEDLKQPNVEIYASDEEYRSILISPIQLVLYDYQDIGYANYDLKTPPSTGDDPGMSEADKMFMDGIGSLLFLPVFFLVIMATQFLGVDIIEEKSSKAIETIIASVPAKTHFLSKITASISFLLIQSSILIGFGILAILVSKVFESSSQTEGISLFSEFANRIPNWEGLLIFSLLFMFFGTLLFLTLAAFLAAISTTQEDYQQFQAPLIFLLLGSYYLTIFLPLLNADGLLRVFSFIPFFSMMIAPLAYVTGTIGLVSIMISLSLTIITVLFVLYVIAPVYRVAILSYDHTKFFKRIKFYMKKAFTKR